MAVSVVMPALEMAQETGRLLAWRKKEGDRVEKGEALLEIETDKAVVEIEAPGDGILAAISAQEGAVVPVGRTIAWLVQPGESPPGEAEPTQTGRTQGSAPAMRAASPGMQDWTSASSASSVVNEGGRSTATAVGRAPSSGDPRVTAAGIKVSPKARRLAKEHEIDLADLTGSGPGGEILADDVQSAIENRSGIAAKSAIRSRGGSPQSAIQGPQSKVRNPQSAIRNPQSGVSSTARLMAERTTQSWTTVPHFFMTRHLDATALNAAREQLTGVSHTDLLVSVVARTLAKHPRMNASWIDGTVRVNRDINIALAIAVEDGVVTGVIHRADARALADIATRRKELADRARAGRLQLSDITGATFTISNLGMYGVDAFTAIIVPPQAAILAVGAIADRVVAVHGQPLVRPMMTVTLSCDHRVVDGARAAALLNDLAGAIESGIRNVEFDNL